MKQLKISIPPSAKDYSVYISDKLPDNLPQLCNIDQYSKVVILSDGNIADIYADKVRAALGSSASLIRVESGEKKKSIETIQFIWHQLFELGADRKSLLINLGGGVLGDLGGFAASTYMRGIDFVNIPTTLLAAADASIGGKTGFNFAGIKNLIGSFYQPKAVIVSTEFFGTLDDRHYREGFAEIIKHGATLDEDHFKYLEDKLPKPTKTELVEIIKQTCQLKASIVTADETEASQRKLLNFGHTVGHAIESLSHELGYPLLHGEAVAIGMIAEARLGETAGITEPGTADRLDKLLTKVKLATQVPEWLTNVDLSAKITRDKKNVGTDIKWTLLTKIGKAKINTTITENSLNQLTQK